MNMTIRGQIDDHEWRVRELDAEVAVLVMMLKNLYGKVEYLKHCEAAEHGYEAADCAEWLLEHSSEINRRFKVDMEGYKTEVGKLRRRIHGK